MATKNKTAEAAPGVAPAKTKLEIPTETFKADGKVFKFVKPQFILPNFGKMTAAEALSNKEVLAILVQNESSVIQVVEKKAKED
jgi:hypothetical protein